MTNSQSQGRVCSPNHSPMFDNWLRKLVQAPKRIVGPYIKSGDTVLDLGCGPGFFTVEMAKMVGSTGKVIAVDLQEKMLRRLEKKVSGSALNNRVKLHLCHADSLGLDLAVKADFILAYYMVHETPDPRVFLSQVKELLNESGKFLIVEPYFHVSRNKFDQITQLAELVGFRVIEKPKRKSGRSLLLSH